MKRGSVVMLLEVLIAAAIVLWLAQFVLKQYFKPMPVDSQTRELLQSQGVSAVNPRSMTDAARSAVDQANEQQSQRVKELEEALK